MTGLVVVENNRVTEPITDKTVTKKDVISVVFQIGQLIKQKYFVP